MERRDFLASLVVGGAAGAALGGCGSATTPSSVQSAADSGGSSGDRGPNIVFVMADELRYPRHFPVGVATADEWMQRFMPNVYRHLWRGGVVFSNHHTAAGACSPSRGVWVTGLYAHQAWLLTTVGAGGTGTVPPSLATNYPTYGQLLRAARYDVPYIGSGARVGQRSFQSRTRIRPARPMNSLRSKT